MTRKYTCWTKEILEPAVRESKSYAECLRKMGVKPVGGNYKNLVKNIDKFLISTDHMTHEAHNKGKEFVPLDELKRASGIKRRLLLERGHTCECCQLTLWAGLPIPLELDHVNGNNRENSRENLRLLCCNCHAQTPTWRNRKRQ